jgi:hypothetical protein
MGIHFLLCVHGNKRIGTHDVIHDTFVAIAWDAGFHLGWKQLHPFPSITFNSSRWWDDIVFTKDDIHTLVDVVIADPTRADLLPQSCTTQGFTTLDAAQTKERSYRN